jgi:dTMP kinase
MSGLFITFEGGEGAGKSTQIAKLAAHLRDQGEQVVLTREPGGTASAEEIRRLLVNGEPGKWTATTEALLNYAARTEHLTHVIRPALALGKTVLCDRFMDSTRVYQAIAGDCSMTLIDALEREIVSSTRPQLTLIFDLAPEIGLARAQQRGAGIEDRYERKGLAFHHRLRDGFLQIAKADPQRCVVVDAAQPPESVWPMILLALKERGHG